MTAAIFKRASGRRRHNKERQNTAKERRQKIIKLLLQEPEFPGWQSWLAVELEVHRGTIGRDIRRIVEDYKSTGFKGLGPRSKAKKELLDRLSDVFTKRDESRKFIDHHRKLRSSALRSSTEQTEKVKIKRESAPKQHLAAIQRTPPIELAFSIPRRQSRFSRMKCFPVLASHSELEQTGLLATGFHSQRFGAGHPRSRRPLRYDVERFAPRHLL